MANSKPLIVLERILAFELPQWLVDALILSTTAQLAGHFHFNSALTTTAPIHSVLLYFCCAIGVLTFSKLNLYTSWQEWSMPALFMRLALAWGAILLTGYFLSFMIHGVGGLSRRWLVYWYLISIAFLALHRLLTYASACHLRKRGINSRRIVIVGYGPTGQEMHKRALRNAAALYDVRAIVATREQANKLHDPAIDQIHGYDQIHHYVASHEIHEVWITLPMSAAPQLKQLQHCLRNTLVDIRWVPDTSGIQMLSNLAVNFLGIPAVELNRPAPSGAHAIVKHLLDKLFALAALMFLAPLFAVIAMCIKCSSPGPVFFKQTRLGLNGKKFMVFKFRTMKLHREHNKITQATHNDPRITRIGQFLRRTSLDELPQFINVLLGDMSVIGPRPHALEHNELYEKLLEMYMVRHRVKPGITGWAQIHGYRGETDTVDKMEKRVQFDLYYIQHWSFLMDFRILVWTAFKGWTGSAAY
ncbi:MAG: undecaprenyl-phosphate glucose phosphotransferase [Collimonas sp.]|uniref:undecaprenyl-phosphate glucose phosphotransferase n=1 Tax=Collimonas sp. TaxID=1963772 RepID=UPI003263DDF9